MQEFYSSPVAKVYYDNSVDTLFLEYIGKVQNDAQFVEINTAVLNSFRKLNTQKFVADVRKMGIISLVSQKWVVDNLLPGMFKHLGGKKLYHAQFLDAKEILSKVSANNIKNNAANSQFEVVQFSDRDELMEYLKTCVK